MISDARIGGSTPSYLHALALIGQFLNQQRARGVTIAEIESGFLIQYFPRGDWNKLRVEAVHHTDILELSGIFVGRINGRGSTLLKDGTLHDRSHPLFPMGYDTFLRVLGAKLDRKGSICLTICELKDRIDVSYWVNAATFVIREQRRQAVSSRHSEVFNAPEIEALIRYTAKLHIEQMTVYEAGLKINPNDPLSMLPAAFILEDDGRYADAERVYRAVTSGMKDHPESHYHVARLALMRGDRRAASTAIERAFKINDKEAPVWDLHGRILRSQGKVKDAVTAFEHAVAIDPDNGIFHYHLAKGYEAQGRTTDAAREMDLSEYQEAAPAWELITEQMLVETQESKDRDVAPIPMPQITAPLGSPGIATAQPAEAPPPAPAPVAPVAVPPAPGLPSLTTDFTEYVIPWEQAFGQPSSTAPLAASATEQQITTAQLTTFAESATAQNWSTLMGAPPAQEPITGPAGVTGTLAQRQSVTGSLTSATDASPSAGLSQLQGTGTLPGVAGSQIGSTGALPRQPGDPEPPRGNPPVSPSQSGSGAQDVRPTVTRPLDSRASTPPNTAAVEIAAEIMMIQRELEVDPNRADLHRKLGFLLAKQGHTAEAAAAFRRAIEASRTNL